MKKFRVVMISAGIALAPNMLLSSPGDASNARATLPRLVSGATPLPLAEPERYGEHDHPSATGHCGSNEAHQNWELDNSIASDPDSNANLVAAWTQDWADAIVVGYSTDSGTTWSKAGLGSGPQTSGCTLRSADPMVKAALGGHTSALDPWLSFGPGRTVHLTSTVRGGGHSAAIANRSTDGGSSWGDDPVILGAAVLPAYIDTSYVIADKNQEGLAYAAWVKGDLSASTRTQQVSRTFDAGAHWFPPIAIPSNRLQIFGELQVLDDGTLVNVATEIPPQTNTDPDHTLVGPTTVVARRSFNGGVTWTDPVVIAVADLLHVTGARSAMAPDGTIYVSWLREHRSPAGSTFSLLYSKSADGGETWSGTGAAEGGCGSLPLPPGCVGASIKGPPVTGSSDLSSGPGLTVAHDGSVGVMFYDHRKDDASTSEVTTDVWFRRLSGGGNHWTETHLAGPYDESKAPLGAEYMGEVGDYHGLTGAAGGFATTFSVAEPLKGANFSLQAPPTDIFFSWLPT